MDVAFDISRLSTLITPARYIFNAGKTPAKWNKARLDDQHFNVLKYSTSSKSVFPDVDIKGGVATCIRDLDKVLGPIVRFTPYKELRGILPKVTCNGSETFTRIIYPQNKFDLTALYKKYPHLKNAIGSEGREKRLTTSIFSFDEIFADRCASEDDVQILGLVDNQREWRWISHELLEKHPNLHKWKVFLPKSNGTGALGEALSTPIIGTPNMGITQSFISFGKFDREEEARACLKYLKTKFCRALLGTLKVTQDNPKDTWANVPMQDFTAESDIDWSVSVEEIDRQLYAKYGLTEEEIEFIESKIKKMD